MRRGRREIGEAAGQKLAHPTHGFLERVHQTDEGQRVDCLQGALAIAPVARRTQRKTIGLKVPRLARSRRLQQRVEISAEIVRLCQAGAARAGSLAAFEFIGRPQPVDGMPDKNDGEDFASFDLWRRKERSVG
jgi:hypothetical protein